MNEENFKSEFKEKFATIEETLKYIADTQAKTEWLRKQEQIERRKERQKDEEERRKFEEESRKRWKQTQKHLDYITKLTGIALEDVMFQEEKLQNAGEVLKEKRS